MLAVFSTLNVAAQVFGTPRPYTPSAASDLEDIESGPIEIDQSRLHEGMRHYSIRNIRGELAKAGSESWSALNAGLAESRAAFDRANQTDRVGCFQARDVGRTISGQLESTRSWFLALSVVSSCVQLSKNWNLSGDSWKLCCMLAVQP